MINTPDAKEQSWLLSRVASSCFWLSRYRERAEFTARVLDVHLITLLDTHSGDVSSDWLPILEINGCLDLIQDEKRSLDKESILHCLCLDPANSNSIMSCVRN